MPTHAPQCIRVNLFRKKINLSKNKGKLISEKKFTSVVSFEKCTEFNFSTISVYVEEKIEDGDLANF